MKTFYDLTRKERKEYLKEFYTTPFGKEMHFFYVCLLVVVFCSAGMWGFADGFIVGTEMNVAEGFVQFRNVVGIVALIGVVIGTLYEMYIAISFSSWLKYKHKINRW